MSGTQHMHSFLFCLDLKYTQRPTCKDLIPHLWHYWEAVEALGCRAQWEEVRLLEMCPKGTLGPWTFPLALSLSILVTIGKKTSCSSPFCHELLCVLRPKVTGAARDYRLKPLKP